jgi:hypothetical protein
MKLCLIQSNFSQVHKGGQVEEGSHTSRDARQAKNKKVTFLKINIYVGGARGKSFLLRAREHHTRMVISAVEREALILI